MKGTVQKRENWKRANFEKKKFWDGKRLGREKKGVKRGTWYGRQKTRGGKSLHDQRRVLPDKTGKPKGDSRRGSPHLLWGHKKKRTTKKTRHGKGKKSGHDQSKAKVPCQVEPETCGKEKTDNARPGGDQGRAVRRRKKRRRKHENLGGEENSDPARFEFPELKKMGDDRAPLLGWGEKGRPAGS